MNIFTKCAYSLLLAFSNPHFSVSSADQVIGENQLQHLWRRDSSKGKIDSDMWMANIQKWASEGPEELQKNWSAQSSMGDIWTAHISNPKYQGMANPAAFFTIRKGYSFYNLKNEQHAAQWARWISDSANQNLPNKFSPDQVQAYKRNNRPYHSAFFEQNKLAGVTWDTLDVPSSSPGDRGWNIINFEGVSSITIKKNASSPEPGETINLISR
jgi:hypothetical protein